MANVCQYGGKPKGDGTQGCSCYTAPDCSSKEKCPSGLGGEPKADGTNSCNCKTSHTFTGQVKYSNSTHKSCTKPDWCHTITSENWTLRGPTDDGISFSLSYSYSHGGNTDAKATGFSEKGTNLPKTCTITVNGRSSTVFCKASGFNQGCHWSRSDPFNLQRLGGQTVSGEYICK